MQNKLNNIITILCLLSIIFIFTFSTCKKDKTIIKKAEAKIESTNSTVVATGIISFSQVDDGRVKMVLHLMVPSRAGLSVAVHIHEHGMCGNMGGDAHGHWNPTGAMHGKWGSTSFHSGDIGNIPIDMNGTGTLTLETNLWSIGGNDSTRNILRHGIIVHGGVDDYTSQPTGNSGPRIGCGEIIER